jgi:hypothetical protein
MRDLSSSSDHVLIQQYKHESPNPFVLRLICIPNDPAQNNQAATKADHWLANNCGGGLATRGPSAGDPADPRGGEQDLGDIDFVRCSPQGKGEIKKISAIGRRCQIQTPNNQLVPPFSPPLLARRQVAGLRFQVEVRQATRYYYCIISTSLY